MGFEIKYIYHPRKDDGPGYDTEVKEDKIAKVGKPFDDTPLEKCAAAIMAQLARRDIMVVDVEVSELVKKVISFKEAKDGKGIVLKNKKFYLSSTAEMIEEVGEVTVPKANFQVAEKATMGQIHEQVSSGLQPHEIAQAAHPQAQDPENLYANPNATMVRRSVDPKSIDRSKTLYQVYFEPEAHFQEARRQKLHFTEDTRYPVHKVIPSPTGKLDNQQIALVDDSGQVVILDEKFFVTAGRGLMGDAQHNFSGRGEGTGKRRRKLAYEDQMKVGEMPDVPENLQGIPVEGTVPIDFSVPELDRTL